MKRLSYCIVGLLLVLLVPTACQKDTPLPYDGLTGITFQPVSMFTDRLSTDATYPSATDTNFVREYFFTYDTNPDTFRVFKAPIAVLGYTMPFDRPVSIEVDPSSTIEPGSYEIATDYCSVSGGNIQGVLNIRVNRPDISDTGTKKLIIKLVPNDYFAYVNGDGQYFTCYVSNSNHKPRYWDIPAVNNVMLTDYFGIYSNNKFDFIHEVFAAYEEKDYWTGEISKPYASYATLEGFRALNGNITLCTDLQGLLQDAYQQRLDDGGEPIYDENTGKEILFGF